MFDILIKNGTCYAGDGKTGFASDVAIEAGVIAAIGNLQM